MGASGQSSFSVTRNNIAAPPFAGNSAINGVSVKPVTGEIVLGNDVGALLAQLISDREIPMATFLLRLLYPTAGQSLTFQNNAAVDFLEILSSAKNRGINIVFTRPATTPTGVRMQNLSTNGGVEMDMVNNAGRGIFFDILGTTMAGGDISRMQVTGNELRFAVLTANAIYRWFTGANQRMTMLNNGRLRVAANSTDTTGLIQADGTITGDRLVSPRNLTPVTINANQDRGFHFTNEGASAIIVFNLPAAVVNTTTGGFYYNFFVQDADGLTITAAAGDTIRIGTQVTAAAGSISSTVIGSSIRLHCINATEWVCEAIVGPWTI